jgi:hypothetical protein
MPARRIRPTLTGPLTRTGRSTFPILVLTGIVMWQVARIRGALRSDAARGRGLRRTEPEGRHRHATPPDG